ncbi:MAG: lysophospholipase [Bacillota bacterium]
MEVKRESGLIQSFDGTDLFCAKDLVGSPSAVVVIAHGLAEHHKRYDYFTGKLNSFGYSLYRYDQRGHGKSGGERGYLPRYDTLFEDANVVVNYAKRENPNVPVFLFGHSMGGLTAVGYCIKYPGKVNGVILSGTLCADFAGQLKNIPVELDPVTKFPNNLASLLSKDPEVVKAYEEDPMVIKEITIGAFVQLKKAVEWFNSDDNLQKIIYPILVLHGGADMIVSPEDSKHLYNSISSEDKQIKIYEGLYHEILNEKAKDEIVDAIRDWIEKRLTC